MYIFISIYLCIYIYIYIWDIINMEPDMSTRWGSCTEACEGGVEERKRGATWPAMGFSMGNLCKPTTD